MDSTDHYDAVDLTKKYNYLNGAVELQESGRGSGIANSSGAEAVSLARSFPSAPYIAFSMRYRCNGTAYDEFRLQDITDGGVQYQLSLYRTSTGQLQVKRDANTVLGTSENTLQNGADYKVELRCRIAKGTAGFVTVLVDEEVWLDLQGIETQPGVNAQANQFYVNLVTFGTNSPIVDELVLAAGDTLQSIGDNRVDCLFPVGSGTYSQFAGSDGDKTDNYALVDDPTINSDTDYVWSGVVGQTETYRYGELPYSAGVIQGVQQSVTAKKSDAGARTLRFICRIGTTDYEGGTATLTDSYLCHRYIWETNPATGAAWTAAEIAAAEFGFRLEA